MSWWCNFEICRNDAFPVGLTIYLLEKLYIFGCVNVLENDVSFHFYLESRSRRVVRASEREKLCVDNQADTCRISSESKAMTDVGVLTSSVIAYRLRCLSPKMIDYRWWDEMWSLIWKSKWLEDEKFIQVHGETSHIASTVRSLYGIIVIFYVTIEAWAHVVDCLICSKLISAHSTTSLDHRWYYQHVWSAINHWTRSHTLCLHKQIINLCRRLISFIHRVSLSHSLCHHRTIECTNTIRARWRIWILIFFLCHTKFTNSLVSPNNTLNSIFVTQQQHIERSVRAYISPTWDESVTGNFDIWVVNSMMIMIWLFFRENTASH